MAIAGSKRVTTTGPSLTTRRGPKLLVVALAFVGRTVAAQHMSALDAGPPGVQINGRPIVAPNVSAVVLNDTLTALLGSYMQAGMGSCALESRLFYQPKGWERLGDDEAVDAPSYWNGNWVLTPDGERANEEAGDASFMDRASHLPVEGCEEQCDAFRSQGYPCRAVYTLDPAYGSDGPGGSMVSRPECIYLTEKCVQNGRVPCLAEAWCGRNAPAEPDPMLCLFFGRTCQWYNPMTFLSGAFFFMWDTALKARPVWPTDRGSTSG